MTSRAGASRPRLAGDEGITLVLVAMLMIVVLLFAALVVDGGTAYVSHRQAQNAADSGAMAGARAVDQLKFYPVCSSSVPAPCTTFTSTAQISQAILDVAHKSGADSGPGAVTCYLIDGSGDRVSAELCDSPGAPPAGELAAASGVEVHARQTRNNLFAGIAGFNTTPANTMAKASIYNFTGGTGSPFIVCGIRSSMPSGYSPAIKWSYDLIAPDGNGGYGLVAGAVGTYYELQGAQNPTCGANSQAFKGKSDGGSIHTVPADAGIITGNGFQANIQLTVAGMTPCPAGGVVFSGCGMIIPIADSATGSGANTTMHVVAWLAWEVWGSGNRYTFAGSRSDPVGSSCGNPVSAGGGSMKYCGRLLGLATASGGVGTDPGTTGQIHVLRLSQ